MEELKEKIEEMISYLFGKYDMRCGDKNHQRMKKLLEYCMDDIEKHPCLLDELNNNEKLEFFVVQSMIYIL